MFTGASFTIEFGTVHTWESWAGLVLAALLAVVVLANRSLAQSLRPLPLSASATAVAGIALVTSFFLPWQKECFQNTTDLRRFGVAGRCLSANGFSEVGSAAAVLAMVVVGMVVTAAMRPRSTIVLAVAVSLFVATLGFAIETDNLGGEQFGFGYGSFVGFAAAGALVALVLVGVTRPRQGLKAAVQYLVPLILAAAFVCVVVVPWWGVLPNTVESVFALDLSWLTLTGAVVGLFIIDLWIRQTRRLSDHSPELVALSTALIALAVLQEAPTFQLDWRTSVLLGISVPLTLFAIVEARGGVRNLHVPEILRVDRI